MRALAGSIRRVAKVSLFASVLVVAALALAQDSRPAGAVNTEVFFSLSPSNPWPQTNVILIRNDLNPVTLYVWTRKVVDLGGFEVDIIFDDSLMSVNSIVGDTSFLDDTGRGVTCSEPVLDPINDPGHANVSCNTAGAPPEYPFGPQGEGLLAVLTVTGGSQLALTPPLPALTLTEGTVLIDTGEVIGEEVIEPAVIPSTLRSLSITIARCADFDDDTWVTLFGDIFAVAYRFGWSDNLELFPDWDPMYDLNEDGFISLFDDVMGAAMQFGMRCTQPA